MFQPLLFTFCPCLQCLVLTLPWPLILRDCFHFTRGFHFGPPPHQMGFRRLLIHFFGISKVTMRPPWNHCSSFRSCQFCNIQQHQQQRSFLLAARPKENAVRLFIGERYEHIEACCPKVTRDHRQNCYLFNHPIHTLSTNQFERWKPWQGRMGYWDNTKKRDIPYALGWKDTS